MTRQTSGSLAPRLRDAVASGLLTILSAAAFISSAVGAPAPLAAVAGAPPNAVTGAPPNAVTGAPSNPSTGAPPNASRSGSNDGSVDIPAEDIRDIRGPKFVAPEWYLTAVAAGAILLALGAYGAWRWQRHRRRPPPLLPFELALRSLADQRALMQPSTAGEFSIAVSGIVRTYIEQRFDVTATHQTTEEFLRDSLESSHRSLAHFRPVLSEFLQQCDLAKFAGVSLTFEIMEALYQSACAFVRETGQLAETAAAGDDSARHSEAHDSLPST